MTSTLEQRAIVRLTRLIESRERDQQQKENNFRFDIFHHVAFLNEVVVDWLLRIAKSFNKLRDHSLTM